MPAPTLLSPLPSLRITPEPLTPQAFAPFGTVISGPPLPRDLSSAPPASALSSLPLPHALAAPPVLANQGSALKYSPISPLENGYDGVCPSGKHAQARMSLFSCFPRRVRRSSTRATTTTAASKGRNNRRGIDHFTDDVVLAGDENSTISSPVFDVRILERHPFTTQTFIPMDLSSQRRVVRDDDSSSGSGRGRHASASARARGRKHHDDDDGILVEELVEQEIHEEEEPVFLVLVAPTLKGQTAAATIPPSTPDRSSWSSKGERNKRVVIRDPPDLENIRAFIARGGQAVTYAAGTWHAPMVVLGRRRVDFVVVQFVNGVEEEDCQEVAFREGIVVDLGGLERRLESGEEVRTRSVARRVKL
ncbi:hypothetical protein VTN77DRAFT_3448 [Rasamsonia byssochlamydoides]|uniref:uncharacterized protein n=1 Tax=Rasamsonia byssochlamydoides TaxID=89139 RepID=UPI003743FCEE